MLHDNFPIFIASVLLASSPARAGQSPLIEDPVFPPAMRALFDAPTETLRTILLSKNVGEPDGVVRCFRYPGLTVHEVDYGEHGDQSIFVTLHEPGKPLPTCGPIRGRLERTLFDSEQSYFLGTSGPFGLVLSTAGHDGIPFTVHDLAQNRALYSDEMAADTSPSRFQGDADVLKFEYVRAAKGSCSIISGGPACWRTFAMEAKLPLVIANAPPPIALCAKGYAEAFGEPTKYDQPSVLGYSIYVEINSDLEVEKLLRPGAVISCNPQS